jgi:hypothetical protein
MVYGGYVSTSDVEDDNEHDNDKDEDGETFGSEETTTYRSIII